MENFKIEENVSASGLADYAKQREHAAQSLIDDKNIPEDKKHAINRFMMEQYIKGYIYVEENSNGSQAVKKIKDNIENYTLEQNYINRERSALTGDIERAKKINAIAQSQVIKGKWNRRFTRQWKLDESDGVAAKAVLALNAAKKNLEKFNNAVEARQLSPYANLLNKKTVKHADIEKFLQGA